MSDVTDRAAVGPGPTARGPAPGPPSSRGAVRSFGLLVVLGLVTVTSCSPDDGASGPSSTTSSNAPATEPGFTARSPEEVSGPPAEGNGILFPQPAAAPPEGYVIEELLVGGGATRFDAVEAPDDGRWTARPAEEAEYRTRVIVRRPADAAAFSGTVIVEWFNVSAIEAAPDWGFISEEIGREGHAYVGVSAQAQPIEGGASLLEVDVDPQEASRAGVDTDQGGLRHSDPDRYGTLSHPGDAYAYDIFNQVGALVRNDPDRLLGDLVPRQVIGIGESQSAMFLTTFINAVHPLDPVFDGFLVHSRGATLPDLAGRYTRSSGAEGADARPVLIRTDAGVPVMVFEAETDLTLLGYALARQPDTDSVRTWEVAGTAHADAQTLRAVIGGPRDPSIGSILGCGLINTGPHKEVLQAAVHHLVEWVAGGPPPPAGPRLELIDGGEPTIARGEDGIALGGVRNPLVDVPVAMVSGDPPSGAGPDDLLGEGDLCLLFGSTTPFDQDQLVARYGTAQAYVERFRASAAEAVEAGFLLPPDAEAMVDEAEQNRSLFP